MLRNLNLANQLTFWPFKPSVLKFSHHPFVMSVNYLLPAGYGLSKPCLITMATTHIRQYSLV
jgi:hypothetical protein